MSKNWGITSPNLEQCEELPPPPPSRGKVDHTVWLLGFRMWSVTFSSPIDLPPKSYTFLPNTCPRYGGVEMTVEPKMLPPLPLCQARTLGFTTNVMTSIFISAWKNGVIITKYRNVGHTAFGRLKRAFEDFQSARAGWYYQWDDFTVIPFHPMPCCVHHNNNQ